MYIRVLMLAVLLAWVMPARALTVEAGLLTKVDGTAQIVSGDSSRPAGPLMKLAEGDVLQLQQGARVQLVYFENGRQETWSGQGEIRVGVDGGESAALQAKVRKLPAIMVRQLQKTPAGQQHGKAGMVVLRALPDIDAIVEIEDNYQAFRAEAEPDDTMPELYFINGMLDLKQYDRVREFLGGLRAREAEVPALAEIIAHYAPLVGLPEAGQ